METNSSNPVRGFVVVERSEIPPELKRAVAPVTNRGVHLHYRGIEGNAWPRETPLTWQIHESVAPLTMADAVRTYHRVIADSCDCDLIYITRQRDDDWLGSLVDLVLCGYDYGFYRWKFSCYSAIYNEVLFGHYPELTRYAAALNEHMLLPSLETAMEFGNEHQRLEQMGYVAAVSPFPDNRAGGFVIYAVYSSLANDWRVDKAKRMNRQDAEVKQCY